VNDKLEGMWKEVVMAYRNLITAFSWKILKKINKTLQYLALQDSELKSSKI
jgi:hypothetical protein